MRSIRKHRTYFILLKIKSKISTLSDQSKLSIIFHKLLICLTNTFPHYSYRKRDIEHLLTMTDSFKWEELPARNPETGNITHAGYIPIIQTFTRNIVSVAFVFHCFQSTVRIVMTHEMMFPMWFPFDASWSPLYEIITFIQVMFTLLP
jgi:hypothetical protein